MSYEHKWVNDGYNFFAIDENGAGFEWNEKPQVGRLEWVGDKSRHIGRFSYLKWRDSLQQRYTAQQMELEALNEGWVLWNAGDGRPDINECIALEIMLADEDGCLEAVKNNKAQVIGVNWEPRSLIVAYRLSNADGYKDGIKQDAKPASNEWIDGKPPVGEDCEWCGVHGGYWVKCKIQLVDGDSIVIKNHHDNEYQPDQLSIKYLDSTRFRPIQSKRDKTIEKASNLARAHHWTSEDYLIELYDAGMLTLPDGEGE